MKFVTALAGALVLLAGAAQAQTCPTLVNPVVVALGTPVHITPIKQDCAPIPIGQATLLNLPSTIGTSVKDSTGFVITAVAPGSYAGVRVQWSDGVNPAVQSGAFTVTVPPPPPAVTAVGTISP